MRHISLLLWRESGAWFDERQKEASALPLADFVTELFKDVAAVEAAIDLPWTTSPVQGKISRLKTIERTMYGRAGFDLLRARVLYAA